MNSKIQQINELAMQISKSGTAHVFVSYSGHVDGLHIYANPSSHPYEQEPQIGRLLYLEPIYLDWEDADKRLDDAIAQLNALRDQEVAA